MELKEIKERDESIKSIIEFNDGLVKSSDGGLLKGKTLAIKSNLNVEGLHATCASKTLENYSSVYDAFVIEKIKNDGAHILGMANMDEFACGGSGESSAFGETDNPNAIGHIPGGSSSGSAAAVAAGFVDMALGSDTGGSIRNPASHCGIVGYKPTYGVVSRYGLIDLAMSLDQIGPLANNVEDAALLLEVISGHDNRDQTSLDLDSSFYNFSKNLDDNLDGLRLGYAKEFDELVEDDGIRKVIRKSVDKMSSAGAEIIDIDLPNLSLSIPTYYLNVYVEFFSATRKFDGRRYGKKIEDVCGEEVMRRILLGSYISEKEYSGKYYRKALQARSVIRKEMLDALSKVDVLVGPTVPKLPHKLGSNITDPRVLYAYDVFTTPVNLAGLPAGTVPAGDVKGIPTGLQIIGKPLEDQKVLNVMAGFESC